MQAKSFGDLMSSGYDARQRCGLPLVTTIHCLNGQVRRTGANFWIRYFEINKLREKASKNAVIWKKFLTDFAGPVTLQIPQKFSSVSPVNLTERRRQTMGQDKPSHDRHGQMSLEVCFITRL